MKAKIAKKKGGKKVGKKELASQARFKKLLKDHSGAKKTKAILAKKKAKSMAKQAKFKAMMGDKSGAKKMQKKMAKKGNEAKLWKIAPLAFKGGDKVANAWYKKMQQIYHINKKKATKWWHLMRKNIHSLAKQP